MIHSGDWFSLLKKEPHYSLLRVDFSFDYTLDELLSIDIKKSRILLIGELASFIMKFLGAPRREAEKDTEIRRIKMFIILVEVRTSHPIKILTVKLPN